MPLESFYGGKQGVSPIIKARFEYVTDAFKAGSTTEYEDEAYGNAIKNGKNSVDLKPLTMEACFADSSYTDVWYGELAIINTKNKNNKNNGKLFRRTLKRTDYEDGNSTPHAEYLGTIVGPSSGFPFINVAGSIEGLKEQKFSDGSDYDFAYPVEGKGNPIKKSAAFNKNELATRKATVSNGQLIAGYDGNNHYETGIKYSWVNVRNNTDGQDEDTYVYLGFQIPYTYFDFDFNNIEWNANPDPQFLNEQNYGNGTEPFYQHRKIDLKNGKPGDSIGYLRRVKAKTFKNWDNTQKDYLYDYNEIFNNNGNLVEKADNGSVLKTDGIDREAEILVYTIKNANIKDNEIHTFNCFLSTTHDLTNIEMSDDGTVTFSYSDTNSQIFEKKIKWINRIESGTEFRSNHKISTVDVYYNNDTENLGQRLYIPYVYDAWLSKNNNDNPVYNIKYRKTKPEGGIPDVWDATTLQEYVSNNDSTVTSKDFNITWIDSLKIDDSTKELLYKTSPLGHRMNSGDQVHEDKWTSFSNEVYLNNIDKTIVYNDHLYVLYSSSEFRYEPTSGYTTANFVNNRIQYSMDVASDGQNIWVRSTWQENSEPHRHPLFEPKKMTPKEKNQPGYWWLDLGPVIKNSSGVWVVTQFDTERFVEYFKQKATHIPEEQRSTWTWGNFSFANNENDETGAILSILNGRWPNNAGIDLENIDGGWTLTFTKDDETEEIIETSPYKDGHIYIYNYTEEDGKRKIDLRDKPIDDKIGSILKYKSDYFYYDYQLRRWMLAESLVSAEGSSGRNWPIILTGISEKDFPDNKNSFLSDDETIVIKGENINFADTLSTFPKLL